MLKLGRVTKVKVCFLVLVYVFNIDLFEFFGRHFGGVYSLSAKSDARQMDQVSMEQNHLFIYSVTAQ